MITKDDFIRVNNCVNGNPRYVLHYLALDDDYNYALRIAYECGGTGFGGKDYGGNIVFSTYCLSGLIRELEHIKAVGLPIKATVRSYKGACEVFYYDNGEFVAWDNVGGHSSASVGYYKKTKSLDKAQAVAIIKDYNQRYNTNLVYSSRLNHN